MPSLCVDQMNILIWRYLQENGYGNAAYTFGLESSVVEAEKHCSYGSLIPLGALVRIVNKGIMFTEAEEGANTSTNYSLMEAVMLLDKTRKAAEREIDHDSSEDPVEEVESEEDSDENTSDDDYDDDDDEEVLKPVPIPANLLAGSKVRGGKTLVKSRPKQPPPTAGPPPAKKPAPITAAERKIFVVEEEQRPQVAKAPITPLRKTPLVLDSSHIKFLSGHGAEAFICSWNPIEDIVASGSGDSTGRLWYLQNNLDAPAKVLEKQVKVLKHSFSANMMHANKHVNHDVTSLDWSTDGSKLATGCYDGYARIWSKEGVLHSCLEFHKGPIFAVKWNVSGDYLVTAGVDRSTVVWNADGTKQQDFLVHESSALDVDWVANDAFASCSTDKKIVVCRVNNPTPIQTLVGHQNEVNAIRYDPHSDRIASCSDDKTLKIWSIKNSQAVYTFHDHAKEIYTLRWNPHGHMVATASFDHTVRLFDVSRGECVKVLQGHTDPVYSVTFSPDGRYIASGCFDRSVFIWHVATGTCVAKYVGDKNDGGIFEVNWSHTSSRLAASASDGKIILMDVRKIV